jgi:tetratricopeptide (TPR) repeat protein
MSRRPIILTPKNPLLRTRTRRKLWIAGTTIVIVSITVLSIGRPVRNAVRSWQARKHAERAFAFIDQQKWSEARNEATTAYQLSPNEPLALRSVARLLSRAGRADGLEFWKKLAEHVPLTAEDLRDEVNVALKINDITDANEVVQQLLALNDAKHACADTLMAGDIAVRRHDFVKAAQLGKKALDDPTATRTEQLQAAVTLDIAMQRGARSSSADRKQIDDRLVALAAGDDQPSLDALAAIAQRELAAPNEAKKTSPMPVDELIRKIDNHPRVTISYKLLAADLEISQQPDKRPEIEQRTIAQCKKSSNEDLVTCGAWLFRNAEYQRELEMIPIDRAVQTRELFLQHVAALAALKRWDEIQKLLEGERYPLDPVIQNMYLAHCYAEQRQQVSADNSWQRAVENAAGDLNKLLILGSYAEKNGADLVAATAYEAAVASSPKSREAQLGRLRAARADSDTRKIYVILNELLKIWPNDPNLQNDEAYVRLLLLPANTKPDSADLKSIESTAENLVRGQPNSLPHRTVLALALLKENRPYTALDLYRNLIISREAVSPSTMAVHAAVLAASGQPEPAKDEIKKIPAGKLLPEERALISR